MQRQSLDVGIRLRRHVQSNTMARTPCKCALPTGALRYTRYSTSIHTILRNGVKLPLTLRPNRCRPLSLHTSKISIPSFARSRSSGFNKSTVATSDDDERMRQ
jgi:hypothetical protein